MKVILQRVSEASVTIDKTIYSEIEHGLLILVGIQADDTNEDAEWLAAKICNLRVFDDENGVMNKSLKEVNGNLLVVSQFTLMARTQKGNRPSYIDAAPPTIAIPIYEEFVHFLNRESGKDVKTGQFGENMKVALVNNGPVTIIIDSKNR